MCWNCNDFLTKHRWFSGRMLACHAGGPGSIPGRCKFLWFFFGKQVCGSSNDTFKWYFNPPSHFCEAVSKWLAVQSANRIEGYPVSCSLPNAIYQVDCAITAQHRSRISWLGAAAVQYTTISVSTILAHTSIFVCCPLSILDSLVVRISACHVEGPGSIPGRGESFSTYLAIEIKTVLRLWDKKVEI